MDDHVATVTINRPKVMNAFRARTCDELVRAFREAGYDRDVGAIVLTGAGERAFCTGGDQSDNTDGGYAGGRGAVGMAVEEMHTAIRDAPKPVIAKVRGYAIGGGNVLATLCDLTLAAESAIFGQVGPKMGSVDPGFGTAYLARVVGEKKAREMWYLCRATARRGAQMGLVNAGSPTISSTPGVPNGAPSSWSAADRDRNWRDSSTDSESIRGSRHRVPGVALYYGTEESKRARSAAGETQPNS